MAKRRPSRRRPVAHVNSKSQKSDLKTLIRKQNEEFWEGHAAIISERFKERLHILHDGFRKSLAMLLTKVLIFENSVQDNILKVKGKKCMVLSLDVSLNPSAEKSAGDLVDIVNLLHEIGACLAKAELKEEKKAELEAFWDQETEVSDASPVLAYLGKYRAHIQSIGIPLNAPFEKITCIEDILEEFYTESGEENTINLQEPREVEISNVPQQPPEVTDRKMWKIHLAVILTIFIGVFLRSALTNNEKGSKEVKTSKEKKEDNSERKVVEATLRELSQGLSEKRLRFVNSKGENSGAYMAAVPHYPYEAARVPSLVYSRDLAKKIQERNGMTTPSTKEAFLEWMETMISSKKSSLTGFQYQQMETLGYQLYAAKGKESRSLDFMTNMPILKKGVFMNVEELSFVRVVEDIFTIFIHHKELGRIQFWVDGGARTVVYWDREKEQVITKDLPVTVGGEFIRVYDLLKMTGFVLLLIKEPYTIELSFQRENGSAGYIPVPHECLPSFHSLDEKRRPRELFTFHPNISSRATRLLKLNRENGEQLIARCFQEGEKDKKAVVLYPDLIRPMPSQMHKAASFDIVIIAQIIRDMKVKQQNLTLRPQRTPVPGMHFYTAGKTEMMFENMDKEPSTGEAKFLTAYSFGRERVDLFFQLKSGLNAHVIFAPDPKGIPCLFFFDGSHILSNSLRTTPLGQQMDITGFFQENSKKLLQVASNMLEIVKEARPTSNGYQQLTDGLWGGSNPESKK
jgi:ribosomal protein S20